MRKTKAEAEQTRQALLDSALHLFDEKGYESTTLANIAHNAKVTRGALYHYFDNKTDLLKQLAEGCYSAYGERTEEILSHDNSWREYASHISEVLSELITNPNLLSFLRIIERQRHLDSQQSVIADVLTYYDNLFDTQLHRVIDRAVVAGDIPTETNKTLAFLHLHCMINGIIKVFIDSPENTIKAEQIDWLIYQSFEAVQLGAFCHTRTGGYPAS